VVETRTRTIHRRTGGDARSPRCPNANVTDNPASTAPATAAMMPVTSLLEMSSTATWMACMAPLARMSAPKANATAARTPVRIPR
jgi:hypothetical protein